MRETGTVAFRFEGDRDRAAAYRPLARTLLGRMKDTLQGRSGRHRWPLPDGTVITTESDPAGDRVRISVPATPGSASQTLDGLTFESVTRAPSSAILPGYIGSMIRLPVVIPSKRTVGSDPLSDRYMPPLKPLLLGVQERPAPPDQFQGFEQQVKAGAFQWVGANGHSLTYLPGIGANNQLRIFNRGRQLVRSTDGEPLEDSDGFGRTLRSACLLTTGQGRYLVTLAYTENNRLRLACARLSRRGFHVRMSSVRSVDLDSATFEPAPVVAYNGSLVYLAYWGAVFRGDGREAVVFDRVSCRAFTLSISIDGSGMISALSAELSAGAERETVEYEGPGYQRTNHGQVVTSCTMFEQDTGEDCSETITEEYEASTELRITTNRVELVDVQYVGEQITFGLLKVTQEEEADDESSQSVVITNNYTVAGGTTGTASLTESVVQRLTATTRYWAWISTSLALAAPPAYARLLHTVTYSHIDAFSAETPTYSTPTPIGTVIGGSERQETQSSQGALNALALRFYDLPTRTFTFSADFADYEASRSTTQVRKESVGYETTAQSRLSQLRHGLTTRLYRRDAVVREGTIRSPLTEYAG